MAHWASLKPGQAVGQVVRRASNSMASAGPLSWLRGALRFGKYKAHPLVRRRACWLWKNWRQAERAPAVISALANCTGSKFWTSWKRFNLVANRLWTAGKGGKLLR